MTRQLTVVRVTTPGERLEAFRLRHRIFVEELRYRIPDVEPENGIREPEDDDAVLFVARDRDEAVGTLALDLASGAGFSTPTVEHLQLEEFTRRFGNGAVCVIRKALVARCHRGTAAFRHMIAAALDAVSGLGAIRFCFIDCSPYLVRFYERIGCRRYAPSFTYDDTGIISVPMCVVLDDHEHLRRSAPWMIDVLQDAGRHDDPEVRRWFRDHWDVRVAPPATAPDALPDGDAEERRSFEPAESPLFDRMEPADVRYLLDRCRRRTFPPGKTVVMAGDAGRDVLLLTEGYVEIAVERDGRRIAVATLGEGDILGEIGMLLDTPRTASARSLTAGSALTMSGRTITDLFDDRPAVAARLFLNLARILAERVRRSSLWISESPPL